MDAHGTTPRVGGFLSSMLTLFAMIATPLFGLLVDKVGKRATVHDVRLAAADPGLPDDGLHPRQPLCADGDDGLAFSLIPAIMWPSVAYIVDPDASWARPTALMTMIQNIGLFGIQPADRLGQRLCRTPAPPIPTATAWACRSSPVLGFLGMMFAFLLQQRETGPHGHGWKPSPRIRRHDQLCCSVRRLANGTNL